MDEIILYHLGIGAGNPPTDPSELAYTYEGADLKVIPSFATIPSIASMLGIAGLPGIDVNLAMLLHGEHEVELHRPIPLNAQAKNVSKIAAVYDKGKGAVMHVETITSDASGPVFTNRAALFIRGEGGFGGESGPQKSISRPHRDADLTIESPTLPQQALLYRLSGIAIPFMPIPPSPLRWLRPSDLAWAVLIRGDPQSGRRWCLRKRSGSDHALSRKIRRRGVPGRDNRYLRVENRRRAFRRSLDQRPGNPGADQRLRDNNRIGSGHGKPRTASR